MVGWSTAGVFPAMHWTATQEGIARGQRMVISVRIGRLVTLPFFAALPRTLLTQCLITRGDQAASGNIRL